MKPPSTTTRFGRRFGGRPRPFINLAKVPSRLNFPKKKLTTWRCETPNLLETFFYQKETCKRHTEVVLLYWPMTSNTGLKLGCPGHLKMFHVILVVKSRDSHPKIVLTTVSFHNFQRFEVHGQDYILYI